MRTVGLAIGWLLLLAAFGCLAFDVARMDGNAFALAPLGQVWFALDPGSLNFTQAVIERYIWASLWDPGISTLLQWPAFFVFLVPGVILLMLFRQRGPRPKFRKP